MAHSTHEVTTRFFEFNNPGQPLRLRCGIALDRYTLAYETYGRLNAAGSNAVLLFHAMTGSQHAAGANHDVPGLDGRWVDELHEGWWDGFIGPGKAIDTGKFFVICANYLGGCYGSTGPVSINPGTGKPWGPGLSSVAHQRHRRFPDSSPGPSWHRKGCTPSSAPPSAALWA